MRHLTEVAARSDCPVIIQVGDFGYFPDHRDGPRFISSVDQACTANGVELWFIDGNHDDHTSLAQLQHKHVPVHTLCGELDIATSPVLHTTETNLPMDSGEVRLDLS